MREKLTDRRVEQLKPADRRLLQIDEFDAGDRLQDFSGGFHYTGDAGMPVQCDPHLDLLAQPRDQQCETLAKKPQERRHLERLRSALPFDGWNRGFGELDVATRAPRDHLPGLGVRHLLDRVRAHTP